MYDTIEELIEGFNGWARERGKSYIFGYSPTYIQTGSRDELILDNLCVVVFCSPVVPLTGWFSMGVTTVLSTDWGKA